MIITDDMVLTMDFGDALIDLEDGFKVAREGWNGKNMFLFLVPEGVIDHPVLDGTLKHSSYIAMKTAQGEVIPWVTSQADVQAKDWVRVP